MMLRCLQLQHLILKAADANANALIHEVRGVEGKKGKRSTPLMRPIICICNDVYAPALRPLREAAEVVEVLPPHPRMLQARLRDVCDRERVAVQETVRYPSPSTRDPRCSV
jgi:hypothetical protein